MTRDAGVVRYARAVERALAALDDRPFVLSPRDFARVSDWYARGIPLGLVREALDEQARRARGCLTPGRALSRIGAAVEEAWLVVREGRPASAAGRAAGPLPPTDAALDAWRGARDAAAGTPLAGLIERLLARAASGDRPETLDAEMDAGLASAAPRAVLSEAESAAARDLAPFRGRMEASAYEATRHRSVADRLRRALGLPRLALTRPGRSQR